MRLLVVGGGSGGHITPALAVVREVLEKRPRTRVEFWTDRKYYKNVVKNTTEIGMKWGNENSVKREYIRVRRILAGKFRRYAGWKFEDYFRHFDVTLKDLIFGNFLGFLGFLGGLVVSFARLLPKKNRPDVIFLKGGFVGLPVGIAAKILGIPYVIHESDMVPGLANRILMKKAEVVAMGMPFEEKQGREKWRWVGIPVGEEFKKVSAARTKSLKKSFGFDEEKLLVVITGGSQGSLNLDEATRRILPDLLEKASVGLVAGRKHYETMIDLKKYEDWDKAKLQSNFRMWEFNSAMFDLLGAADVVVSRAGATTIAELANLGKAVILVPYARLPGGHQVKNAELLEKEEAVLVVNDEKMQEKPEILLKAILNLLKNADKREELAAKLHGEAKPEAARELAEILFEVNDAKR
ncbi:UDP-N-acetylglucosamine--N-acetylmuramyl-(pentapeptide) pyrophosphoryl-undecaprenol N-acetylglucosamine transferase [Candidatus Saccharibacteria bacterium]|nr:UDP-N-acetylglucosamine--N-acetylmuramyl-(pentapeptide) pyrophosphoryl-undecaprenol N-acetylglucosamine transferase [Candidatus Saccharibacteria bacterium]